MLKEKPGDDTGMQTRVWGPAGWLFLHSIAQNYPWKPTPEQQEYYFSFFKLVGNVLPCRYCRESYQKYIEQGTSKLTLNTINDLDLSYNFQKNNKYNTSNVSLSEYIIQICSYLYNKYMTCILITIDEVKLFN